MSARSGASPQDVPSGRLALDLHGVGLSLACARRDVLAAVGRAWPLPTPVGERPDALRCSLAVADGAALLPAAPPELAPLFSQGQLSYYHRGGWFGIRMADTATVDVDLDGLSAAVWVVAARADDIGLVLHLISAALAPLLRRRNLLPLHAFVAAHGDRAVLLHGPTGSGKTTAGLALVRRGWSFIANDRTLLADGAAGVSAFGFPEPVRVAADARARFPELADWALPEAGDPRRLVFDIEGPYPGARRVSAPVGLVVLPRVAGAGSSRLEAVPPAEALPLLMDHGVEGWDVATVPGQFALLARLAARVPTVRLYLGDDLEALPGLVGDALVARTVGAP